MIGIDIFLIYDLQVWKRRIKSEKDSKNTKNMNKEDFSHEAQVDSTNYRKGVKPKSTSVAIKRESSQEEKTPPERVRVL